MLRMFFQIFKKLYHFTTYTVLYSILQSIYIYRPSYISLVSKLKNVLANGDSIAKVSVEGCQVIFIFIYIYIYKDNSVMIQLKFSVDSFQFNNCVNFISYEMSSIQL